MIIEKHASSVAEVFERIKEIRCAWNPNGKSQEEEIWFRGQPRRKFRLLPGLYRADIKKYKYDELTLFEAFKALAAPLYTPFGMPRPSTDWEWYFLAQHYRMPTRLLDWTENALAAIYFAISEKFLALSKERIRQLLNAGLKPRKYDKHSPTIWILDAGTLNKWSCGFDEINSPTKDDTDPYLPEPIKEAANDENKHPIPMHPPRANPRIIAQQGMFTVHGHMRIPIDEIAARHNGKGVLSLACIILDRNNLAPIWDSLDISGVGQLALFPELDSVSEYLKRAYQATG